MALLPTATTTLEVLTEEATAPAYSQDPQGRILIERKDDITSKFGRDIFNDFDLDALRPVADRVGPTPADLGQDPSLRTDPEEVRTARWWKDEYKVQPPG